MEKNHSSDIPTSFQKQTEEFDLAVGYGKSFDVVKKPLLIGQRYSACFYYLSTFSNQEVLEKILGFLTSSAAAEALDASSETLYARIPFAEIRSAVHRHEAVTALLSGMSVFFHQKNTVYYILDTRKYPDRGIKEPDKDKVLRGPRDGLTELLSVNIGLIRRRIRDERLVCEKITVGQRTKTDLVLCYMDDLADKDSVALLRQRIRSLQVQGLNMGQESLAEVLVKGYWNPFPKIRYTERPDSAAAGLMEGSILVFCDNYPSAMILPTSIFDFLQDTDDFYFPPIIGIYLKGIRNVTYFLSLLLTPVWYLLVSNPEWVPERLSFILLSEPPMVPLLLQILLMEFCIDGLKMASLNTPDSLTNSLSVVSALLIGDFAVSVGWLSKETILYMAFVAIAGFTQPNYELGYAFKLLRIVTLILIGLFDVWGFLAGAILTCILIATNPTIGKRGYLYPLIPFNARALMRLLFRVKLKQGKAPERTDSLSFVHKK